MTAKVDWSYHRPGCKTCAKTQDFLTTRGVEIGEEVNAKKTTLQQKAALDLEAKVDHIYVTKGKTVVYLDLRKEKHDEGSLAKLLIGPTGNLRAPTLRIGKTLLVGFDQDTYEKVLG